jgi:hypothetical protein
MSHARSSGKPLGIFSLKGRDLFGRYVLAVQEPQRREWHMRTIKAASMYVAAGLGVRRTNHQFRSISLIARIQANASISKPSGRLKCWVLQSSALCSFRFQSIRTVSWGHNLGSVVRHRA